MTATAARHGVTLSSSTVVRILRAQPDPTFPPPRIVGIDDWAIAKGHRYATVVVDLERHRVIDILPDRTADTVAAWLREHPSVETVSRDRAVGYANAAREGAPQAEQVANRWHLLKNLGESIEHFLRRLSPFAKGPSPNGDAEAPPPNLPPEEEPAAPDTPALTPRQIRYAEVHRLAEAGWKISQIARELSCDRKTVRQDLLAPPPDAHPPRGAYPRLLDPFEPFLPVKRWSCISSLTRRIPPLFVAGKKHQILLGASRAYGEQLQEPKRAPHSEETGIVSQYLV